MNLRSKKLYRSRSNRFLAGVCGGLGDYFDIDATWIRLAFAIGMLAAGVPFLVYLIMWFVIPRQPLIPVDPIRKLND
jgi:phage shock protein C